VKAFIPHIFLMIACAILPVPVSLHGQSTPPTENGQDSVRVFLQEYINYLSDLDNKLLLLAQMDDERTYKNVLSQVQSRYADYRYQKPVRVPYLKFTDSVPSFSDVRLDQSWVLHGLISVQDSVKAVRQMQIRALRNRLAQEIKSAEAMGHDIMEYDPVDYRPFLRNILNRPEYQPRPHVEDKNILAEAVEWIFKKLWELLKDLFKPLAPPSSAPVAAPPLEIGFIGQGMIYIVYAVGAILAVIVIWKLIQYYRRRNKESGDETKPAADLILEPGESRDPDEHFLLAEQAAANGDYRRAVRHLLLSVILYLDRNDYVRFQNCKTNQEYLDLVLQADIDFKSELHGHLTVMMRIYDRSWYGMQSANRSEYETCLTRYHACMALHGPVETASV